MVVLVAITVSSPAWPSTRNSELTSQTPSKNAVPYIRGGSKNRSPFSAVLIGFLVFLEDARESVFMETHP